MAEVLDCTLRDGGYQCDWLFPDQIVESYLNFLPDSSASFIELGIMGPSKPTDGVWAEVTEPFLSGLNVSKKISVLINSSDVDEVGRTSFMKTYVPSGKDTSTISLFRITTTLETLETATWASEHLNGLGFSCSINLMQGHSISLGDAEVALEKSYLAGASHFYVADSFGCMRPHQINSLFRHLDSSRPGKIELGFHGHDNLGLALENTLMAADAGADILDATYASIGRGAGNTSLFDLMLALGALSAANLEAESRMEETWRAYQLDRRWGVNSIFRRGAQRALHPSYTQLVSDAQGLSLEEKIRLVDSIPEEASSRFDRGLALGLSRQGKSDSTDNNQGTVTRESPRRVLVVGGAPVSKKDLSEALHGSKADLIISISRALPESDVTQIVTCCNPLRAQLLDDDLSFAVGKVPLVAPMEFLRSLGIPAPRNPSSITDFYMRLGQEFSYDQFGATLTEINSLQYALAYAGSIGAREISLVGFAGVGDLHQDVAAKASFEITNVNQKFSFKHFGKSNLI